MKLTKSKLKEMIKEEIQKLNEGGMPKIKTVKIKGDQIKSFNQFNKLTDRHLKHRDRHHMYLSWLGKGDGSEAIKSIKKSVSDWTKPYDNRYVSSGNKFGDGHLQDLTYDYGYLKDREALKGKKFYIVAYNSTFADTPIPDVKDHDLVRFLIQF
jgi:hypothetical protein